MTTIVAKKSESRLRRASFDEDFFEVVDSEEKAYWLGFIATDGCNHKNGRRVSVELHSRDRDHLVRLLRDVQSSLSVYNYCRRDIYINGYKCDGASSVALLSSRKFSGDLARLGVTPAKSHKLKPWSGYMGTLSKHYWRGCIDGDGCICHREEAGTWAITFVGTEAMVRGFEEWAKSVLCYKKGPKVFAIDGLWRVVYGGRIMARNLAVALYGGCGVSLRRKQVLADGLIKTPPDKKLTRHNYLGDALTEIVAKSYSDGKPLWQIALDEGISTQTAANRLKKAGLTARTKSQINCGPKIPIKSICKDYQSGMSAKEVAERYGVTDTSVYNALRSEGISSRGRWPARVVK